MQDGVEKRGYVERSLLKGIFKPLCPLHSTEMQISSPVKEQDGNKLKYNCFFCRTDKNGEHWFCSQCKVGQESGFCFDCVPRQGKYSQVY